VFNRCFNIAFQSLKFLRPYLGFQFLRQGSGTLPELVGVFLGNAQPVVGRAGVFLHAAALKMGQPDKILRRNEPFFRRLQIAFDGVVQPGLIDRCGSADDGIV
jgi:hypothetical protein